jgi:hypothetical protein
MCLFQLELREIRADASSKRYRTGQRVIIGDGASNKKKSMMPDADLEDDETSKSKLDRETLLDCDVLIESLLRLLEAEDHINPVSIVGIRYDLFIFVCQYVPISTSCILFFIFYFRLCVFPGTTGPRIL